MATPHYVAQKVGDQYVLVRTAPPGVSHKPALLLGGALLSVMGVARHGTGRWVFLVIAAGLFTAALSGTPFSCEGQSSRAAKVKGIRRGPSFQNDDQSSAARQKPEDDVDEAAMESFPASDPPAH